MQRQIVLILPDIRSSHNVGSIFRTADGFGVQHIYLSGYTPYPRLADDPRLPHAADRQTRQINKTALGAIDHVPYSYSGTVASVLDELRAADYTIAALEQDVRSTSLPDYARPEKLALILGNEVDGVPPALLDRCDVVLEIPMRGHKESFNVAASCAIALYALTA